MMASPFPYCPASASASVKGNKKKEIKKSFDYLTKWVMKRLAFAKFFYLIKNSVVITQGVLELITLRISILVEQSPHIICFLNFKDAILTAQRS